MNRDPAARTWITHARLSAVLRRTRLWRPAVAGCGLVVAFQALLLTYLVWRYGVDVPVLDQGSLVEDLEALHDGQWRFWHLWRSHNGRRILLPRLILVPLGLLTGWNTRVEMALSLVVATAIFGLLAWGAVRALGCGSERSALAIIGASTFVYSLAQWENWL